MISILFIIGMVVISILFAYSMYYLHMRHKKTEDIMAEYHYTLKRVINVKGDSDNKYNRLENIRLKYDKNDDHSLSDEDMILSIEELKKEFRDIIPEFKKEYRIKQLNKILKK